MQTGYQRIFIQLASSCGLFLAGCRDGTVVPAPDMSGLSAKVIDKFTSARTGVQKNPRSASDWGQLGKLCMANQFMGEAIVCFQTASRFDPADGRWNYYQAVLLEEVDLELSAKHYSQAIRRSDDMPAVRFRNAQVLLRLERLDEAQSEFQCVAQLSPEHPAPQIALARLAITQSDWTSAEEHLQKALVLSPHSPSVYRELARIAASRGNGSDASKHLESAKMALGSDVSLDDAWLNQVTELELAGQSDAERADRFLVQGRLGDAAKALESVVQDHPELHNARLNLSVVLWQMGRIEEAQRSLNKLITLFPDEPHGYLTWGRLLAAIGRFQEAKLRLEQAIDRKADAAEASTLLGMIAEKFGDDPVAIEWYRRATQAAPEIPSNHLALAKIYHRTGDIFEAERELTTASRLKPENIEIRTLLQQIHTRLNGLEPPASALTPDNLRN